MHTGEMVGKDGEKMIDDNSSPEKLDAIPVPESTNILLRMLNSSKDYVVRELTQESDFHVKAGK
jgi:hypothetical protein